MNNTTFVIAFLVAACVYTEAQLPQCRPLCHKQGQSMAILCVRDSSSHCHRMRQCSIEEENCRRRLRYREPLVVANPSECQNIRGHLGSARCAPVQTLRKPHYTPSNCHRLHCFNPSKKLKCYRNKQNRCQLLTACQLNRINCQRDRHSQFTLVDARHCYGMSSGQPLKLCRPRPRRN